MLLHVAAVMVASAVGYALHALAGPHLSVLAEFFVSLAVCGPTYVYVYYKLRRLQIG